MTNGLVFLMMGVGLLLGSCSMLGGHGTADFAGDWQGSGADSQGNRAVFAAKVIDLGGGQYRMLVLDSLDTQKKPMHVMEGMLADGTYTYTADGGLYHGECKLEGDLLEGYYAGSVDGTFTMQRVSEKE